MLGSLGRVALQGTDFIFLAYKDNFSLFTGHFEQKNIAFTEQLAPITHTYKENNIVKKVEK